MQLVPSRGFCPFYRYRTNVTGHYAQSPELSSIDTTKPCGMYAANSYPLEPSLVHPQQLEPLSEHCHRPTLLDERDDACAHFMTRRCCDKASRDSSLEVESGLKQARRPACAELELKGGDIDIK
jgi:hypothetical protein